MSDQRRRTARGIGGVHPMATTFLVLIGLGTLFFLVWAAFTHLDEGSAAKAE